MAYKIARELVRPFDRLFFRPWLRKSDGKAFCFLFNIRSFLACKIAKVQLRHDPENQIFYAANSDVSVAMFSPERTFDLYRKGVQDRIEFLAGEYFLPQIDFDAGDLVVDCGANIGELAIYFKSRKIPVDYIGIEPAPREYKCLEKNAGGYTTHNVGLWKEEGEDLEFFVSSERGDSSFITPSGPIDRVIKIPTRRLDGLLTDKPIKLFKLEAEGGEPEVLMGCEGILDNIEYISANLGPERGLKEEMTMAPVTNLLMTREFELMHVSRHMICLFRNQKLCRS